MMNAESLHKIFNNTRISSYLRNPLIKKGKSVFISKGECDYCGCENEELRNLKFKMCDECVEYYKINKEYVLNNLQIETKKDKIAERIHQSIFYSRKKIDSLQDICYPSLEGIVLIDIPTGMLGGSTFIHELGHYASLNLLYDIKPSDAHIEVYAFDNLINLINKPSYDNLWKFLTNNQGKITDFNPSGQCSYTGDLKLSNFGKLLGEEKSMGLFLAAGVAVNTLTSFGLIGLGYLLRKKKIGKPLMYAGILPAVDTAFYVFRGFFNPELETAVAPALLGLTPLTFASLIISPVPIALGLTMLKYFYDKRKSNMRKIVDNLINYDMIGKNELFTQFNTYNKNEVIDSLEEKLSKKIDWLFYSGGSEEKKVVKKIKQITKNLLEEYSGFADYLAKEFKPLVKEKKKEWKEWGALKPTEHINSFKNELSDLNVPDKKIKKTYKFLFKNYNTFCMQKKENKITKKFLAKTGLTEKFSSNCIVFKALQNFYNNKSMKLVNPAITIIKDLFTEHQASKIFLKN